MCGLDAIETADDSTIFRKAVNPFPAFASSVRRAVKFLQVNSPTNYDRVDKRVPDAEKHGINQYQILNTTALTATFCPLFGSDNAVVVEITLAKFFKD